MASTKGNARDDGAGNARSRQLAQRRTAQQLNNELVTAANDDLQTLAVLIDRRIQDMNLINLSTALHRLGRACTNNTATRTKQQALQLAQPAAQRLLAASVVELDGEIAKMSHPNFEGTPHCQAFSNITWSMATLDTVEESVVSKIVALSLRAVAAFKPVELAGILWSMGRLVRRHRSCWLVASPLFQAAAERLPGELNFRCLVMIAWAFAAMGHRDDRLFWDLGTQLQPFVLLSAQTQDLEDIKWAFATVGVDHGELAAAIARRSSWLSSSTAWRPSRSCAIMTNDWRPSRHLGVAETGQRQRGLAQIAASPLQGRTDIQAYVENTQTGGEAANAGPFPGPAWPGRVQEWPRILAADSDIASSSTAAPMPRSRAAGDLPDLMGTTPEEIPATRWWPCSQVTSDAADSSLVRV